MVLGFFIFRIIILFYQWHYGIEREHHCEVGDTKHKEFNGQREDVTEPSPEEITEEQQPERTLNTHAERTPMVCPKPLIPQTPCCKRQATEVTQGKPRQHAREQQQRNQTDRKVGKPYLAPTENTEEF